MDFARKIREALLDMNNPRFVQETSILFYITPGTGQRTRVDFIERYTVRPCLERGFIVCLFFCLFAFSATFRSLRPTFARTGRLC
jgi:hypothetical protein